MRRSSSNIYDPAVSIPEDYPWSSSGRAMARARQRWIRVWFVVFLVLLAASLWWLWPSLPGVGIVTLVCTPLSAVILYTGLYGGTAAAFGNRALGLDADGCHDYLLSLLHWRRGRHGKPAAHTLLMLAQLDIVRGRADLAPLALAGIDASKLGKSQLERYELVQEALSHGAGRNATVAAVEELPNQGLAAGASVACGLMLAHCVFFAGVWLGVDRSAGWCLRIPYGRIAAVFVSVFVVALTVMALAALWSRHNEAHGRRTGTPRIVAIVARTATLLVAIALAGGVVFSATHSLDGSERVVASGISDGGAGRAYDYLSVQWNDYDTSTTSYYRACDPILMEPWPAAGAYATSSGTALDTSGASSGTSFQSSRPTAETAARQSQMRAVYAYLEGQGTLSNMSLSFGTDAEGAPYAIVSTGTEDVDGTTVSVEHRLYDDGEAVNDSQVVQEEFVLEKVYPTGERETEIEGFYLVDMVSLEVTDEHKTTW